MATTLASLVVRIGADVRGITAGLGTLDRRMKASEAASARIARAYRVLLSGAAVHAASKVFELGASVEETASKFETVFGRSSASMDSFIDDFGNLAGLSRTQAREITATTGAIVQGMGLAQDASAAYAQEVARLSGDLASFNNAKFEDTSRAVTSAITGERESLKKYGIVITETDVQQRALIATGKTMVSQLTQEEKALATLSLISERAGVAVGDLARTQDSAANRARRLGAQFRDIREAIAASLLPVFEVFMDHIEDMMGGTATFVEWLKTSAPIMTAWAEVAVAAFKAVGAAIMVPLRVAFEFGQQLANIGKAMVALITRDWPAFHAAADEISQSWTDMGGAFEAVGERMIELYDRVRIAMETFGETTVSFVRPALERTEEGAAAAATEMERLLAALNKYNAASSLLGGVARIPGLGFLGGLSNIAGTLGGVLNPLAGVFSAFGGAKADGGPVSAGTAYVVGERGPEMFVPSSSGTIVPNGGSGMRVVYVPAPRNDVESRRDRMWFQGLADELRANGYSFA